MSNITKVVKFGSDDQHSYCVFIPKALFQALGGQIGDKYSWEVVPGGFKLLKIKND